MSQVLFISNEKKIDDAGSLNILEQLPSIEVLTLCGNPICKLPNYRPLVISLLPCLRSFDGKVFLAFLF